MTPTTAGYTVVAQVRLRPGQRGAKRDRKGLVWPPPSTLDHIRLVAWFTRQPADRRDDALYWAACRVANKGVPARYLVGLYRAAVAAGLNEPAARQAMESALGRQWR